MNELIKNALEVAKQAETAKNTLKEYFQNMEHSYEDRWECFLAWASLGGSKERYYYSGFDNLLPGVPEFFMYDGFYHVDRYQTVDLFDVFLRIEEYLLNNEELSKLWKEFEKDYISKNPNDKEGSKAWDLFWDNRPEIRPFREKMMEDAITSFTYDW